MSLVGLLENVVYLIGMIAYALLLLFFAIYIKGPKTLKKRRIYLLAFGASIVPTGAILFAHHLSSPIAFIAFGVVLLLFFVFVIVVSLPPNRFIKI
jgi:hypothetical protein